MKKLLATDLDGTLLKNDKTISINTINAIHNMINNGHYFVISTGRPFFRITKILETLDIINGKNICICNNGGLIITTDGSKVLYEEKMDDDSIVELVDLCMEHNLNILVYQKDYIVTDYLDERIELLKGQSCVKIIDGGKPALKELNDVYKVVFNGSDEELFAARDKIPAALLEKYNFVYTGKNFLEVNKKTIDKGKGLKRLADILEIDLNNTYAVGDEENDLELIKAAGVGCAVSNANQKVKEVASYITLSNEDDGVAHIINELILKESILVSACLLGDNCKYNGGNNLCEDLIKFLNDFKVIKICPECFGGLTTPRVPAEIIGDKVINKDGIDVTDNYQSGAKISLELAGKHHAKMAILKAKSPSCGVGMIYDGTFSNTLVHGDGICAKLLKANNIELYTENNYQEIFKKKS